MMSTLARPLRQTLRSTSVPILSQQTCRCQFSTSRPAFRVADDFVNIIEADGAATHASVGSLSSNTFTLTDGLVVPSPVILLNGVAFMWDVKPPSKDGTTWEGWDPSKLEIFEKVTPRPEILFIGTGPSSMLAPPKVRQYLNNLGIQVDVLDSKNASATYNLLLEEGRRVAAALYPLEPTDARTGRTISRS